MAEALAASLPARTEMRTRLSHPENPEFWSVAMAMRMFDIYVNPSDNDLLHIGRCSQLATLFLPDEGGLLLELDDAGPGEWAGLMTVEEMRRLPT